MGYTALSLSDKEHLSLTRALLMTHQAQRVAMDSLVEIRGMAA